MRKPVYTYPDFVSRIALYQQPGKRYWLTLTVCEHMEEELCVILKNPSRANREVSDKTVYNVASYIYRNKERYEELRNVGKVTILNLIPFYQTYSDRLQLHRNGIADHKNLSFIDKFSKNCDKVILAWGNHPKGLYEEYEALKEEVKNILRNNGNSLFYVDRLSLSGNPKHGQVWGYQDSFCKIWV
ncbi:DUF1643 domain-containing protein [Poritiphilus flavus]|uniref:DUF1643 domain-containing protein n=1 Tax=Poritiphilus flavus TaxID=2697053 RepID=A0A6L9EA33_9FLAO|nr:DUF1643 domain-containing protein [Poritiphilus flavus]NAS11635.1 DUF1643 domain-containing protein [Poritiphilus flavus]